jgi:hypothetical protein
MGRFRKSITLGQNVSFSSFLERRKAPYIELSIKKFFQSSKSEVKLRFEGRIPKTKDLEFWRASKAR